MLEYKHLKAIQALAETGSVVKSAERLHMTQSALSHQLKDLEHKLDCLLFVRKTSPIQFTSQGLQLLELAKEVIPKWKLTEARIKQHHALPTLRICVECHACFHWITPAVKQFKRDFPAVEVQYDTQHTHDALPALIDDQLDIVFTSDKRYEHDVIFEPLFDFNLKLVVAADHPLVNSEQPPTEHQIKQSLKQASFIGYPIAPERQDVHLLLHKAFGSLSSTNEYRAVDNTMLIVQMVNAGEGVAIMPDWLIGAYESQGWIKSIELPHEAATRTMYLARQKATVKREAHQLAMPFLTTCQAWLHAH